MPIPSGADRPRLSCPVSANEIAQLPCDQVSNSPVLGFQLIPDLRSGGEEQAVIGSDGLQCLEPIPPVLNWSSLQGNYGDVHLSALAAPTILGCRVDF